jgi:NTP pyrophosphatase (non-canonical NTP hydrolase)
MRLNELAAECYAIAASKGWHDDAHPKTVGDDMALITSEISEALEDFRNGHEMSETYYVVTHKIQLQDPISGKDHTVKVDFPATQDTPGAKPCGVPIELADALIRIFDVATKHKIDLDSAVAEKMAYNELRSYRHGGKVL